LLFDHSPISPFGPGIPKKNKIHFLEIVDNNKQNFDTYRESQVNRADRVGLGICNN
jgi:hypothetical protein